MKYWNVRTRFQRAFFEWLAKNRHRFLVRPFVFRRTDRHVDLRFHNVTPLLSVRVTPEAIEFDVDWDGEYFDSLQSLDLYLKRTPRGHICPLCDEES